MPDPSTVFVLGAGASAADGAPVQGRLLREFYRSPDDNKALPREMVDRLATFFSLFFGIDTDDPAQVEVANFPTFEELLGILDLAQHRGEEFREWPGAPDANDVALTRSDLSNLIAVVLHRTLETANGKHVRFAEQLRAQGLAGQSGMVSLNYDILIDNALGELYPDFDIDYGLPVRCDDPNEWHAPADGKGLLLLKFHGSLNWLRCPVCQTLTLTPWRKGAAEAVFKPGVATCPSCDCVRRPLLVPPTYFKSFTEYSLASVWQRTEELLRHAETLVICGYSFPDADVFLKYVMKRAQVNARKLKRVVVLNDHAHKADEERRAEYHRIARFFGNNVHFGYLRGGFAELADDPDGAINGGKLSNWAP